MSHHCAGGVAARPLLRSGKTSAAILATAEGLDTDLLVVGACGMDRVATGLLGSTPENLVRGSRVPVLVVRNRPDTAYRTVLLGIDLSEAPMAAARYGMALAPEAEHIVVHVSTVPGEHLMRRHGASETDIAQPWGVSPDRVRPRVEQVAASLAPPLVRPPTASVAIPWFRRDVGYAARTS
ncbi:universal stress protein [Streptomyces caeni]|uniref:Universal stress protein n=1 Tax=Streptomyces caeni TaxID=2307231 RepID=A0ABW4IWE7_9ACTN